MIVQVCNALHIIEDNLKCYWLTYNNNYILKIH